MRVNKTKNNLQAVWKQLDDACGGIDQAFTQISLMTNVPEEIQDRMERIDFSAIVMLKDEIERLIEEKNK